MSEQERYRALLDAKSAAALKSAPLSRHDAALRRYLGAAQYETANSRSGWDDPVPSPIRHPAPVVVEILPAAPAAAPRADLVIVGVDGSQHAAMAAEWAADDAVQRNAALRLVYAYSLPVAGYAGYSMAPDDLGHLMRVDGEQLLVGLAAELRSHHPTLEVQTRLVQGDALLTLRRESAQARLTVVGSRGNGRMAGVVLGSFAMAITAHGTAPVAVIPTEGPGWVQDGPIVVGVDGSPTNEAAIRFAFEQAALRDARLVAVHTWNHPKPAAMVDGMPDLAVMDQTERALLSEELSGLRGKYPDVDVQQHVAHGKATAVLLSLARSAQLLVVGSRGRGGFAGMLLGSTSHSLITHAVCPVVVVRPDSLN